jgi:HK97 family phage portal protein
MIPRSFNHSIVPAILAGGRRRVPGLIDRLLGQGSILPPDLVDRLRRMWRGPRTGGIGIFALGAGAQGYSATTAWDFVRIANSVYGNPTGFRCVNAIVSNFSRPPWMVLPPGTTWPDISSEVQALQSSSLLDLLNRPGPRVSGTQMQRHIARDMELCGKAFWIKRRSPDGAGGLPGRVLGLDRLPPQRVAVVGNQDDVLLGFIYTDRNGRQVPILPDDMVYLRFEHPERAYDGMAPGLVAGLPAETDTASARFNRDLLASDGALPGYMILQGLTPDQFAEWKAEWESGSVPGKTRFIRGQDAKYVKVGQSNAELTYVELRQDSQDDVMRAFGVPRAVAFDVSHETYANAEREQALFMQHNIAPKWTLVADEMTLQLMDDFDGEVVAFNTAGIDELQDSRDAVVDRATKLMGMKAMTINEFRRSQGMKPVSWGDEPQSPLQPMSAVPLQPGDEPPAPPALPAPPAEPDESARLWLPRRLPASNGHRR